MTDSVIDDTKLRIIRRLRQEAHLFSVWEAPRVSKDAEALNACADQLERNAKNIPN
jgi:hypothetical protein